MSSSAISYTAIITFLSSIVFSCGLTYLTIIANEEENIVDNHNNSNNNSNNNTSPRPKSSNQSSSKSTSDNNASSSRDTPSPVSSSQDKDAPHIFSACYRTGKVLGEGGFSTVKLAVNKRTNQKAAVKIVSRPDISAADEAALRQEVGIMQSLSHAHVVHCFDFFEEEKYYYLVLEYMEGGELFDRVVMKSVYNEKEARDVVKILVNAIKYLHDHNIVHRDLKPENLLLTSKSDDANLKIADFGFAIRADDGDVLSAQCGTPGYIAPEIIKNEPYGKAVDMWSIGVITYILLGGYPPFQHDNMRALFKIICKGEYEFHPDYWHNVSDDAKSLISGLLTVDVSKRLTADDVLKHPWLQTDDAILAAINLDSNLAEFRKFHATRKFRSAAKAVMAINRMKTLMLGTPSDDHGVDMNTCSYQQVSSKTLVDGG